jgi:hypothetical protein
MHIIPAPSNLVTEWRIRERHISESERRQTERRITKRVKLLRGE